MAARVLYWDVWWRPFVLFLYLAATCDIVSAAASGSPYMYQERVGKKLTPFYWQKDVKGNRVLVSVWGRDTSFLNLCTSDGATLGYHLVNRIKDTDIYVRREGDVLQIGGIREGEKYKAAVEIDQRPWRQPLSFSLGTFLRSDRAYMSFWSVRADSVEPIALVVKKLGEEQLDFPVPGTMSVKLEVRAEGIYSHFWHGTYWFRRSDQLFLMYRAVNGFPGTPETVVRLVAEPERNKKNIPPVPSWKW